MSGTALLLRRMLGFLFRRPPWHGPPTLDSSRPWAAEQSEGSAAAYPALSVRGEEPLESAGGGSHLPGLVEVIEWVDSASINGGLWVSRSEIDPDVMTDEGLRQRSVGWLIDDSEDVVLIAQSLGPDRIGAVLAIPRRSILFRTVAR